MNCPFYAHLFSSSFLPPPDTAAGNDMPSPLSRTWHSCSFAVLHGVRVAWWVVAPRCASAQTLICCLPCLLCYCSWGREEHSMWMAWGRNQGKGRWSLSCFLIGGASCCGSTLVAVDWSSSQWIMWCCKNWRRGSMLLLGMCSSAHGE